MIYPRRFALPFLLLVCAGSVRAQERLTNGALLSALRRGNYVLYLRHPATNPDQADTDTRNLRNIKAQRQLTEQGRAQARSIGKAFRSLGIPVGTVVTSQYFRARETARLGGFAGFQSSLDITEAQNVSPKETKRRAAALRERLSLVPAPGTNTLLISHRPNLQDAAGKEFGDLAEGEVVVFRPLGKEGYRLIARIADPQTWEKWEQNPPKEIPERANVETTGPAKGTLVIVGGGGQETEILKRFLELAGGPNAHLVFVPTANEEASLSLDTTPDKLRELGAARVTVLHTRDPKEADTEKFIEPLTSATGVWFGGGRQWRLADAYLNTRTQKAFEAVLERGGVIGGTSAGATIQGSFLVRGDTKGNELMEGDHLVGFGYLQNAAIDQHILRRNRQFDLIPVIESHPELLGIGIDENTAIVVQGNRFAVIGPGYVAITDARQWDNEKSNSPNHAARKGRIYLLGRGDRFDLKTRRPVR